MAIKVSISYLQQEPAPKFKSRFKFERLWLEDDACSDIIAKNWNTVTGKVLATTLSDIMAHIRVDNEALNHFLATVPCTITVDINHILVQPYTAEDIFNALSSMKDGSCLGLDDMLVMFDTNYWHIVKKPTSMSQLRPISLCNVLYKLVSKAIVPRLKPFLSMVISESQSTFLQSRLIIDNVLVAFELLHSLKHLKRGREGYATIKLDMSKAFDRVQWHFNERMMIAMGFDYAVLNLIIRCISSVSFSFIVNGSTHGHITPTRGIRQGDPLSLYLFIICAEGLSRLFQHEEHIGNLQVGIEQFATILWSIWMERNKQHHGTNPKPHDVILYYALSYLEEFKAARTVTLVVNSALDTISTSATNRDTPWLNPPSDRLKLNTDAAVNATL
uniref:Reverse transcriptase domain-containing protein n=1 Tax=Cannabis sativa TaxID=3483 RepID=A0A803QDE8_CANSA